MATFPGWINPLKCFELEPEAPGQDAAPTFEGLFNWLVSPRAGHGVDAFARRYREIDRAPDPLFVVPDEPHILEKLVWPLRHAKGAYSLSDYLGCVALCGMVGEMVAILIWDISKPVIANRPADPTVQKALFGREFEDLGQDARIRILGVLALIDEEASQALLRLKHTRNRYLHLLSQPHDDLPRDARQAYADALNAVAVVLGQTYAGGAVTLRPEFRAYLVERGVMREDPPAASPT